jgi:hypothetical protein
MNTYLEQPGIGIASLEVVVALSLGALRDREPLTVTRLELKSKKEWWVQNLISRM